MPDDHAHTKPTPAERHAAWLREDPAELRRAADEWAALGYHEYADALRRWADGHRDLAPAVLRPRR